MHEQILILSPHQDDAALSLGASIRNWAREGARVTVLNIFTKSDYSPLLRIPPALVAEQRAKEDRRCLNALHPFIRIRNLGMLDAPLRLGVEANRVCDPLAIGSSDLDLMGGLELPKANHFFLFCPLGIGGHIDHRLTSACARERENLAFYEDLPYALRSSKSEVLEMVREKARHMGWNLQPKTLRGDLKAKARALTHYRSQLNLDEISSVCSYGEEISGERVWLPV